MRSLPHFAQSAGPSACATIRSTKLSTLNTIRRPEQYESLFLGTSAVTLQKTRQPYGACGCGPGVITSQLVQVIAADCNCTQHFCLRCQELGESSKGLRLVPPRRHGWFRQPVKHPTTAGRDTLRPVILKHFLTLHTLGLGLIGLKPLELWCRDGLRNNDMAPSEVAGEEPLALGRFWETLQTARRCYSAQT